MLKFKVTYASLTADNEELHGELDKAFAKVKETSGITFPFYIGGKARKSESFSSSTNPADHKTVIGKVCNSTVAEVQEAVAAARKAYPGWRATPWQERAKLVERAAEIIRSAPWN